MPPKSNNQNVYFTKISEIYLYGLGIYVEYMLQFFLNKYRCSLQFAHIFVQKWHSAKYSVFLFFFTNLVDYKDGKVVCFHFGSKLV